MRFDADPKTAFCVCLMLQGFWLICAIMYHSKQNQACDSLLHLCSDKSFIST